VVVLPSAIFHDISHLLYPEILIKNIAAIKKYSLFMA